MKSKFSFLLGIALVLFSSASPAQDARAERAACDSKESCTETANIVSFVGALLVVHALPAFFFKDGQGALTRRTTGLIGPGGSTDGFGFEFETQTRLWPEGPMAYHARTEVHSTEKGRRQFFIQKAFAEFFWAEKDQSFFVGPGGSLSMNPEEKPMWGGYGADIGYQRDLIPQLQARVVLDYLKYPYHEESGVEFDLFVFPSTAEWKDMKIGLTYKKSKIGFPSTLTDLYLFSFLFGH